MKYTTFFFILLISGLSHAIDEQCAPQIANLSDLEKVECEILKKDNIALKKVHCKQCGISKPFLNVGYRKDIAKKRIVTDLKNSVLVVITEIFKMGQANGYSPKSCGIQGLEAAFKSRESCLRKNEGLIQTINKSITTEIANFTIKGRHYLTEEGLLSVDDQIKQKTCPVSPAELQTDLIKSIEDKLTSDSLKNLANLSIENGKDLQKIWQNSSQKLLYFDHPLIRELVIKNPDYILKNIDQLKTSEQIKSFLYKPENIQLLSKGANEHCSKLYDNFATAICDEDVSSGNTQIGNFQDFENIIVEDFKGNEKVLQHTKELFCSQFYTAAEQISSEPKSITDLSKSIRSMNYGYDLSSGSTREIRRSLIEQIAPFCAEYCKNNNCDNKIADDQGVSKIPKETSNILKDLFDFKSPMSEEKKKIFIASEILTAAEATSVEIAKTKSVEKTTPSPFTPEKEREIFGKVTKSVQPIAQNFSGANLNTVPSYNTNSSYNESVQEEVREKYREKSPVLPPSTAAYLKEMSSMNRDLLDRLVKERGAKDKYSMDEIKDQLAKLSKERELPLPLDQQAQFFDHEWSENAPKVMPYIPEDLKKDKSGRTIASIDTPVTGKALQDKKYQDQRNRALEQFGKGEVSNNNSTSDGTTIVMSVNNEAALKKVRLDVPTDKIEKLNLSSILGQKLVSDKEGEKLQQLIQNKQSFLLDIEGKVAFMVEYSDSKKGFDLKTLKNSLPVEVFEKIKTQISQFLSSNERKHEYQALKQELKVQ